MLRIIRPEQKIYHIPGLGIQTIEARAGGAICAEAQAALDKIAALGLAVSDETTFCSWLCGKVGDVTSTDVWVITNPATTSRFRMDVRSVAANDKISVWWDDGTTNDYNLATGVDTQVSRVYGAAAARVIVVLGGPRIDELRSANWVAGDAFWGAVITDWTNLTYLNVTGSNTLSGSVAALTKLTYLNVIGSNTLSGSVEALTSLSFLNVIGSNTLSGSVEALTSLSLLNVTGSNTLSGSVAALTKLTYLNIGGSNTCTGFDTAAAAITGICNFKMNNALDEATVNGILAGFWANRDAAKPRSERVIDLNDNAASAAPTGQGIIDKAALQAYRSPNNDPTKPLWTVSTN